MSMYHPHRPTNVDDILSGLLATGVTALGVTHINITDVPFYQALTSVLMLASLASVALAFFASAFFKSRRPMWAFYVAAMTLALAALVFGVTLADAIYWP